MNVLDCQYNFLIYFKVHENCKHQPYYLEYIFLIKNKPKGTGKTELLKQVALECKTILFIINVSMIIELEE